MSLEAALAANTAAITALVEVWGKLAKMGNTINRNVEDGTQTSITAGNIEIPVKAPAKAAKVETPKQEPAPAPEVPAEITYEVVAKATLAKMKTDKAAVLAAVAKFGAKNAKELKVEQYADYLKEIA